MTDGMELDLAVAKACGIKVQRIENKLLRCESIFGGWLWPEFRPSVDLNDAFLAAERGDLFKACLLGISGGEWDICQWMPDGSPHNKKPDYYHLAAGPTAAIAICNAILKLAKERQ